MGKPERCDFPAVAVPEMDERGTFYRILTPQIGPCGGCKHMTANFITRDGRTVCVACDVREGREARKAG